MNPGGGSVYVTYMPRDRESYKGIWMDQLKQQKKQSKNTKMYESEYELTEDITVPSRAELKEVFNDLMKKKEHREAVGRAAVHDMFHNEDSWEYWEARSQAEDEYYEKHGKFPEENSKEVDKILKKLENETIADYAKKFVSSDMSDDEKFGFQAWALGTQGGFKAEVVDELKKRGYNAIVDEASVGGGTRVKQGVDPLIIFDRDASMKKNSTNEVSDREYKKSYKKSMKYYQQMNNGKYKNVSW